MIDLGHIQTEAQEQGLLEIRRHKEDLGTAWLKLAHAARVVADLQAKIDADANAEIEASVARNETPF